MGSLACRGNRFVILVGASARWLKIALLVALLLVLLFAQTSFGSAFLVKDTGTNFQTVYSNSRVVIDFAKQFGIMAR